MKIQAIYGFPISVTPHLFQKQSYLNLISFPSLVKAKHNIYSILIFLSIIAAAIIIYTKFPNLTPELIRDSLRNAGALGYLLFILLVFASVILPIPSTAVTLGGGYVYGVWLGTLLALIGNILGASLAFFLVRKFGEPLIEKCVDRHHVKHFNKVFKKRGPNAIITTLAIPLFPSDSISWMLGLTSISYASFLAITIFGHIPRYLIINSLGADFFSGFTLNSLLILALAVIFLLIGLFRHKAKFLLFKELRTMKQDITLVEEHLGIKK